MGVADWMKMPINIYMKSNKQAILFEDKTPQGQVIGAIGFQFERGRLTVYIKGYEVDAKKFPALKDYRGYQLTDKELDKLGEFVESLIPKKNKKKDEKK